MQTYKPAVVVHISPFTGLVGAEPCGIRRLEIAVVLAAKIARAVPEVVTRPNSASPAK